MYTQGYPQATPVGGRLNILSSSYDVIMVTPIFLKIVRFAR